MTIDYWLNRTPTQYVPSPAANIDLTFSNDVDITVSRKATIAVEADYELAASNTVIKTVTKTYNIEVC